MDSRLNVYIVVIFITLSGLSSQSFGEKRFYLDIDNNGSITNEIDDYLELVDQVIPPANNYNRALSWNYAEYIMGLGLIHLQRADSRLIDAMLIGSDHLLSKRNDYLDNLQLFIDEKTRKGSFPNLTRYMTINLNNFHLAKSFGKICFCKNVINPKFDIKIEKPKKAAAEGADKAKEKGK